MTAKKTSIQTKSASTSQNKGKKGGVGVLTPETIGAMAGAAIGGVAGMMIGNRHHKGKLATAKAGAITATKSAVSVLESQAVNDLAGGKSPRKKNTNSKKAKS